MLPWRSHSAGACEDIAEQMCSAALYGSDDVRNYRVQKSEANADLLCRAHQRDAPNDADEH